MDNNFLVERVTAVWVSGNTPAGKIPEYFEWSPLDDSTDFDVMPVVLVSERSLDIVEGVNGVLPEDVLAAINGYADVDEYDLENGFDEENVAILTDLERSIIVVADDDGLVTLKSRVDTRTDIDILSKAKRRYCRGSLVKFDWTNESAEEKAEELSAFDKILVPDRKVFIGLTRRERKMKDMLFKAVFSMGCKSNIKEMNYWISELSSEGINITGEETADQLFETLYSLVEKGWSPELEEFGSSLLRVYHPGYEQDWNKLKKASKDEYSALEY